MRWTWAVVLLAGCTGTLPLPEATAPEAILPETLAFAEPVLVGAGGDIETTVHVTADGTILVCSHGGFQQPSPLWASRDGGADFSRLDPQPNPLVSGDCDLASSADGQWAIVYDTIASATVAASDDGGRTWDLNHASALPIAVDRPWIAWAGDELYMTYSDVMAAEPALQMFARSTDGGRTWLEHTPINVAQPPDELQAVIGKMVVDGDTIHVPLARSNIHLGGAVGLDHAVSRDRGATWSIERVHGPYDNTGFVLPSMAWAGDLLYYTLPVRNGSLQDVHVLRSHDRGATWEPLPVASGVDFPGVVGPWIDGRPDGSATVAWVHLVEGGWTVSAARVGPDGAVEGPVMLAPPEGRDQVGHEFTMVDHLPDGRAVVAWPMDTGPDCDPAPNMMERRGSQCVYAAFET